MTVSTILKRAKRRKPLQMGERIVDVYVTPRGQKRYLYTCRLGIPGYWYCGVCGRGNLGVIPKRNRKCRVCLATVHEVRVMRGEGDSATMRQL